MTDKSCEFEFSLVTPVTTLDGHYIVVLIAAIRTQFYSTCSCVLTANTAIKVRKKILSAIALLLYRNVLRGTLPTQGDSDWYYYNKQPAGIISLLIF